MISLCMATSLWHTSRLQLQFRRQYKEDYQWRQYKEDYAEMRQCLLTATLLNVCPCNVRVLQVIVRGNKPALEALGPGTCQVV